MPQQLIYIDREDLNSTLDIKRREFLLWILESMGIPIEELDGCFPEDLISIEVSHRLKLRKLCEKYSLEILDERDGSLTVYLNKETQIANWHKPRISLKYDNLAKSLNKKLYYEALLEWSAIFQEEGEVG